MPGLCDAAAGGRLPEVKRLLESGEAVITERNESGLTALHYAARYDHVHVVQYLLEEGGASITERTEDSGSTALLLAVFCGSVNTAMYLVRQADSSITEATNDGRTVWASFKFYCEYEGGTPAQKADLYSLLRCFGSPGLNPEAFIAGIREMHRFSPAHRELLLQTERAHAHPDLTLFRARQLQLLHGRDYTRVDEEIEASECTMIRDLRNITMGYLAAPVDLLALLPDAALKSEAVIALVAEGEEQEREQGRRVRPRRE
jgi:hypothetical protein